MGTKSGFSPEVICALLCWSASIYVCPASAQSTATVTDPKQFFEMRIRPLLAKNCFGCHSDSRLGGLRLDTREGLMRGGEAGVVIVPWHPKASLLIQAVSRTHERFKMPPQAALKEEEIADLVAWVKMGAIWPETGPVLPASTKNGEYVIRPEQRAYWAFQPVRKPSAPAVKNTQWPKTAIDRFILSKLEEKALKPVRPADKQSLIRRATFDLIGLPPTPEEVEAFVNDSSPMAFAKVVDQLLASPHYGERWGRYWLDYARYADERLMRGDANNANAFRYRDWVVQAFNQDMPYDLFVKAQIAGDLLNNEKLVAGLGFYALTPPISTSDDRVDVTTRTFLGLTVACAQCHDHKFDPIPTKDYYSLLGIFRSTEPHEVPLAPRDVVERYQSIKNKIDRQKADLKEFNERQSAELGEILAAQTSRYMRAGWNVITGAQKSAGDEQLDRETLDRWVKYLSNPEKDHNYLKPWFDCLAGRNRGQPPGPETVTKIAGDFQTLILSVNAEKKSLDEKNRIILADAKDADARAERIILALSPEKYFLWRDIFSAPAQFDEVGKFDGGVVYYGPKQIDRFLLGEWKRHLESLRDGLAALEKALPPKYPFLHALHDSEKPANAKIEIRGDPMNLGEEAPRRFLRILSPDEPRPFTKGSGRLELAEAIASPDNPLTARVMVNRIWQSHFGQGIVRTPSNFGQLGDRPSHPELLDYLAARFVENKWSMKAMHREIMLSATYALSTDQPAANVAVDAENRLFWRANIVRRLDAEALRDSLLFVAGNLDLTVGGPPVKLTDDNKRRTIYAFISRNKPDAVLQLFDFPNPNSTSEQRLVTLGPLQRLYFMNSSFVALQAKNLAKRLNDRGGDDETKIATAYRLLFSRSPSAAEMRMGLDFVGNGNQPWVQYALVLLSSSEFSSIN